MKKIYSFVMVSIIALTANAQVFNENFSGYNTTAPGNNLVGQGSWSAASTTGTDVKVLNTTPLTYTGYQSGTEYVETSGGAGIDPQKTFLGGTSIPTSGDQYIYMSFVVRVNSISSTSNPGGGFQSVALQSTANSNYLASFFIDRNGSNSVRFGIAVGDENHRQDYLLKK
jgi:hypothetical protein